MPSLLLFSVLLGCTASAQPPCDTSEHRARRQETTLEDTVEAAVAAAFEARVQAVADANVVKRLDDLKEVLAGVLDRQQDVQQTLSGLSRRLDDVTEALTALSDQQQDARQILGALPTRQEIQQGRVLGDPCRGDPDCGDLRADTVCGSQGRCVCAEGLQEVAAGACRPYPRLSQPCRLDTDCQGSIEHTVCADGKCSCSAGFQNHNDTECRRPRLSEACTTSSDCQVVTEHSVCTHKVCTCADRFWNDNNAVCQPYPRLSEPCNTTSDCEGSTEHAVCADNVCTCAPGSWNRNDIECRPGVAYEQHCDYNEDCSTTRDSFTCSFGKCACKSSRFQLRGVLRDAFVRLQGDSDCQAGYVEILAGQNNHGLMCDGNWAVSDATVLCRTLGFSHGRPQESIGVRHLEDVVMACTWFNFACSGSEETVDGCDWQPIRFHDFEKPVAVKCYMQ